MEQIPQVRIALSCGSAIGVIWGEDTEDEASGLPHENWLRGQATYEILMVQWLERSIRAMEAAQQLLQLKRAAHCERDGEDDFAASETGDVDYANRVNGLELGRDIPSLMPPTGPYIEAIGEMLLQVAHRLVKEVLYLILVAETSIREDRVGIRKRMLMDKSIDGYDWVHGLPCTTHVRDLPLVSAREQGSQDAPEILRAIIQMDDRTLGVG